MISRQWASPSWWVSSGIPEARDRGIEHITRSWYRHTRRVSFSTLPDEDWDICLWLDGCRYDMFAEHSPLDGTLEYRHPARVPTYRFLEHNFVDRDCSATVYVTAHPMYRKHDLKEVFHAVDDVWIDGWDEDLNTVTPEIMAERTITAAEQYPNKRILAHWMQPHYPFIGQKGQSLMDADMGFNAIRLKTLGEEWRNQKESEKQVWKLLEAGELDRDDVWDAYVENLEVTFPHLQRVLKSVDGKTVITSDHGNHLGEYATPLPIRIYGHPRVYTDANAKVPWLIVNSGERRDIVSESRNASEEAANEKVNDRLADLGYIDEY